MYDQTDCKPVNVSKKSGVPTTCSGIKPNLQVAHITVRTVQLLMDKNRTNVFCTTFGIFFGIFKNLDGATFLSIMNFKMFNVHHP